MSTATVERDRLVSQPAREVVYAARREDLRLVRQARYPIFGPQGQQTGLLTEGVTIGFSLGTLRVPLEGEIATELGGRVDAAELNEWLQSHRLFGDVYEGFVKVEMAQPPVSPRELGQLVALSQSFDREGLEALIEQEREGWNRPELIESARAGLAGIARLEAEALAQAEAKAKKG